MDLSPFIARSATNYREIVTPEEVERYLQIC
jgi:hypothetical protein